MEGAVNHDRYISIHAPRMGSDARSRNGAVIRGAISIHAPRMGSDYVAGVCSRQQVKFQSTPPVWGATAELAEIRAALKISIHAPRMGSDNSGRS